MRRFTFNLTPYVRDFFALAILTASVATVFGVAAMNGKVHEASVTYSVTSSDYTASL